MRLSHATLRHSIHGSVLSVVEALARNSARTAVNATTPGGITNNSGGAVGSIVAVPRIAAKTTPSGANLAGRTQFNAAIGTVDAAIANVRNYLAPRFAALDIANELPVHSGPAGTAGTVAAVTGSATAVTGAAEAARGAITFTGQPANGETVTLNGKVYTFQTTLTNVDGNVAIGATTADSRNNLVAAINLGTGGGALYAAATTLHPTIAAAAGTGTVVDLTAKTAGAAGNTLTLAEAVVNATVSGATLTGGNEGNAMLMDEANRAIDRQRNNFATLLWAYNTLAVALGVAKLSGAALGSTDAGNRNFEAAATATTAVAAANVGTSKLAGATNVTNALTALRNDIATLASRINTDLFPAAVLTKNIPIVLAP